jgi:hypothetical protein
MKRETKEEMEAEIRRLRCALDRMERVVAYHARGERPDATVTTKTEDGWRWTYHLYGATAAHGGIVVAEGRCKANQYPVISVTTLDDRINESFNYHDAAIRAAINKLANARRALFDNEGASPTRLASTGGAR